MQGQLPSVTENTWKYWSYMIISNSSTNNSVSTSTFSWVFPTILVGRLQHQPLLVELHLNDSSRLRTRFHQGRSRDFSAKKTGRERASSSVATRLALTVEGSTVTQAINQRRWSFPSLEMSSFLKKDFFMMSPFNWQLVLIFMRSMNIGRLTWNPSKQAPW